jgi:hypothetical protein
MRSDNHADSTVEKQAECLLLARRLGVKIDQNGIRSTFERTGCQFGVDSAERAIDLRHENAAHGVDDKHVRATFGTQQRRALAGCPFRKIERPHEAIVPLDENQRVFLIKRVIAERHAIRSGIDEVVQDGFRAAL